MEHTLEKIISKPSDYLMCKSCGHINWYENKECVQCGDKIKHKKTVTKAEMEEWADEEEDFWKQQGYELEEMYLIKYDV